jgi:hypothetical protein
MEVAEIFRTLSPVMQLALIVGGFATFLVLACNPAAEANVITSLRALLMLYKQNRRRACSPFRSHSPTYSKRSVGKHSQGYVWGRDARDAPKTASQERAVPQRHPTEYDHSTEHRQR